MNPPLVTDIMECMANSDNVIRAGLTPKLRDIPNLVSGLTYSASLPTKHTVKPAPFSHNSGTSQNSEPVSVLYDPPSPEFSVVQVKVPPGHVEVHPALDGPSITIVTEGSGTVDWGGENPLDISQGHVFFIGAGTEVKLSAGGPLVVYRAFVEAH